MKVAKTRILMFDVECPECGELIETWEGNGSLSWSIHESAPSKVKCNNCGKESKMPKGVMASKIQIEESEK